jgi:hypothetical protein
VFDHNGYNFYSSLHRWQKYKNFLYLPTYFLKNFMNVQTTWLPKDENWEGGGV